MIIVVKKLPFKINLLDLFRFFHKICACKSYIAPVKYSLSILKKAQRRWFAAFPDYHWIKPPESIMEPFHFTLTWCISPKSPTS